MSDSKIKVTVLRSHPSLGYFAGDTAEISQALFAKVQAEGPFLEEIKASTAPKTAEKAPETTPKTDAEPPKDGPKQRKQTR